MWETLERARRRLFHDDLPVTSSRQPAAPPSGTADPASTDLTFALGRVELERAIAILVDGAGPDTERPDTPARLEAALRNAIERAAGRGRPTVTRRPAGLYTPESWHIEVAEADARTRAALEPALRRGGAA
jgi:hypothetical protein